MIEILKIPNFPGYFATSSGLIISVRTTRLRVIKQHIRKGYYIVGLQHNGKHVTKTVSRLIAETFLINYSESLEVNHIDGDTFNNNLSNLEMVTSSENVKHAWKIGSIKAIIGELHPRAKLDRNKVLYIRSNPDNLNNTQLGKKFGVDRALIGRVKSRKSWGHIN